MQQPIAEKGDRTDVEITPSSSQLRPVESFPRGALFLNDGRRLCMRVDGDSYVSLASGVSIYAGGEEGTLLPAGTTITLTVK